MFMYRFHVSIEIETPVTELQYFCNKIWVNHMQFLENI